ncbi:MAG: (d)CMP kinase [Candidatus Amulumruptor caecigallinarius]|nr:(d)CMP kinase [Candidatus Amulumruptor caecigallinarius]MCM1396093.1 (d)CMP kinase [Candidatus Amulumruptor caecigallinarius]MCM1453898.1 (d)CMP kinase [bacterium]
MTPSSVNTATPSAAPLITIAIDGYSSSGKSSMAKQLAREIGYRYIDSGAMYRAVTLAAIRAGAFDAAGTLDVNALLALLPELKIDFRATPGGQHTLLNGEDVETDIRSMAVASKVSLVAEIGQVRRALTALQQSYGKEGGIVMDGRDIGTTVFPGAQMKVFVTASPETRARRRFKELTDKGLNTTYEEVLANVISRDHIDETRAESPLRRADDAKVLDNSSLTPAQQDEWLMNLYHNTIAALARED